MESFYVCNQPLSAKQVCSMVKRVFKIDVNKQWVSYFKRRHKKDFSKNKIKNLSDKRTGRTLEEDMEHFICRFQEYVDSEINASGMNLLNYDETRIGPPHSEKTVVERFSFTSKGLKEAFQSTRNHIVSSMMPFVGADGKVLAVFYIIPGKFSNRTGIQNVDILNQEWKRENLREYFVFNETGFMNSETFEMIIHKVATLWDEQHPGVNLFLLGDGCSAHTCNPDLVVKMFQQKKNILFLPPNTTHFTQPLDSNPFGSFKLKVYSLLEEKQMISFLSGEKPAKSTIPEGQLAAKEALSTEQIQAGFKKTGIWPWNPKILRENCKREITGLNVTEIEKNCVALCTDIIKESKGKLEQKQKRRIRV